MISTGRWIALIASVTLLGAVAIIRVQGTSDDSNDVASAKIIPPLSPSTPLQKPTPEIPEEDLRDALKDLCGSGNQESIDGNRGPEDVQTQNQAFNELTRTLLNRLSVSPSAEHLYLAALLEGASAPRVDLIDQAIALTPNDAFVLWGAVHICAEVREAKGCQLHEWEQRLLEVDGHNSESWMRVATNRNQAGDFEGALDALRHAATSAETRTYWTETIEMIERGFAAGSDYAFPERAAMAFGLAATMVPNYGDYVTMCKEQSTTSVDWAYACLAYGELVESQGKTDLGVLIARGIQKLALKALGDEEKLAAVERRQQTHRREMFDSVGNNFVAPERLILSNPTLFSAYLAVVRTHGEPGARVFLAEETSRLIKQQPELACAS